MNFYSNDISAAYRKESGIMIYKVQETFKGYYMPHFLISTRGQHITCYWFINVNFFVAFALYIKPVTDGTCIYGKRKKNEGLITILGQLAQFKWPE